MRTRNMSNELREMLYDGKTHSAMEAHSGISAIIAEDAGFEVLWASGLAMSAVTGYRDRNELCVTEVAKIVEYIADHTSKPILVDGDTGGVDFNSAVLMAGKYIKAGAAGVCLEDKKYPKSNSLLDKSSDKGASLADPELHAGKIRAIKDTYPEFVVVARLESLIAGVGTEDALRRARIYRDAGADAILVHSKISTSAQLDDFMKYWNKEEERLPVVIVPTNYYNTPTEHFEDLGISLVIWANHSIRASIGAMQDVTKKIFEQNSIAEVQQELIPVSEIFRLQKDEELEELEKMYAPNYHIGTHGVILAGGTLNGNSKISKTMVKLLDKSLLDYQIDNMKQLGIDVDVASGVTDVTTTRDVDIISHTKDDTTEVGTLVRYILNTENNDDMKDITISYGDIFYRTSPLTQVLESESDITLVITDRLTGKYSEKFINGKLERVPVSEGGVTDVFVGLVRIKSDTLQDDTNEFIKEYNADQSRMKDFINFLIEKGYSVDTVSIDPDDFHDINCLGDLVSVGGI